MVIQRRKELKLKSSLKNLVWIAVVYPYKIILKLGKIMRVSFLGFGTISHEIMRTINSLEKRNDIIFEYFYDPYYKDKNNNKIIEKKSFQELKCSQTEIIIEAASQVAVKEYIADLLLAKKNVISLSVGAYLDSQLYSEIDEICKNPENGKLYIPSGALPSVDSVMAGSLSHMDKVELTTRKPINALSGAPGFKDIAVSELTSEKVIFSGTAIEAVKKFPKNINIAATLSLIGIGPERTKVTIIADPKVKRNIHTLEASGSFGKIKSEIRNEPSANPKTSMMAALSASSLLLKITGGIKIGS